MTDKHNISKGKMHTNCMLLPDHIVCKITKKNNIRRANTCDQALKLLNEEITSDTKKHEQTIWMEHLDAHWDHRHNTHSLKEHAWSIQQSTSNHTKQLLIIQQPNYIHILRIVSPNNSQTLSDMQHTKQTDLLTDKYKIYKDIISHSPQLRSTRQ